jgi:hypothetical protein
MPSLSAVGARARRFSAVRTLLVRKTLLPMYDKAAAARVKPGDAQAVAKVLEGAGGVQGVPKALVDALKAALPQDLPAATKVC